MANDGHHNVINNSTTDEPRKIFGDHHHHHQQQQQQKFDWENLPLVALCNVFAHLSTTDRLQASSTCHSWRAVLFNSTLWPQKYLKVNLCPYKFTITSEENSDSGFNLYRLHEPVIRKHHCGVYWLPKRNKYQSNLNRKNFNQHLKTFIQKCSRFLNGITFYFDPNSSHNVMDMIKIVKYLSSNEIAIYELNNNRPNAVAICRNLRHFSIVPITTLVRCSTDKRFMSLYYGLTDAIRFLFSKCQSLEHVSLGNLHELVYAIEEYFEKFIQAGYAEQLRCLQLSSIKGDIYRYLPYRASMKYLEQFESLQHLSIDFDVLNSRAITILAKLESFQTLSINVHRFNGNHPGIANEAWSQLITTHPDIEVSVNLLQTKCSHFTVVLDSLINTCLPLKHFRAYYLDFKTHHAQSLMFNMLEIIARCHADTLQTLVLVDTVAQPKDFFKSLGENVLVLLTWQCRYLKNLTLIGYILTDNDIIAIARLRGTTLKYFNFPASCIHLTRLTSYKYYDVYDFHTPFYEAKYGRQQKFNRIVSTPLKRVWSPLPDGALPEFDSTDYIKQLTYHRTILESQCKH